MTAASDNRNRQPQSEFTLATLNILSGAAKWEMRRGLVLDELRMLAPDVVALQEVAPGGRSGESDSPAHWLAERIDYAHVAFCVQPPSRVWNQEAIALISRLPLEKAACLNLDGQRRVAQRTAIRLGDQLITVANTHLFWQPGDSDKRLRQVNRLIEWLEQAAGAPPCVIAGDFNGEPETRAIRRMLSSYVSAYAIIHGSEPEYTFPTPLKRSKIGMILGILNLLKYVHPQGLKLSLMSTLDYIFVDRRLQVVDCRLAFDRPDPNDPRRYPSDHYGLWARIGLQS